MHRCLQIQEILSIIFAHVPESESDWTSNRTLARLARTCKTFHAAASSLLWEKQYTLDHLMGCLPESSWVVREDGLMVLRRDVPHDGWPNFDFHARFVRELTSKTDHTLATLAEFHPDASRGTGILPRVLTVSATVNSAMGLIGLTMLLGHEVRRFELVLDFTDTTRPPTHDVDALPSICASLRGLDVQSHAHILLRRSFVWWSSSLRKLSLRGAGITAQDVATVALLPCLADLTLDCLHSWRKEYKNGPSTGAQFPSLRRLWLDTPDDVSACTAFLQHFSPPSLTFVQLGMSRHVEPTLLGSPSHLYDFFTAIATSELSDSITRVSCDLSRAMSFGDEGTISMKEIEPLLSLRRLTCFTMYFEGNLRFTDEDFGVIAGSWPSLETLSLFCTWDIHPWPEDFPTTQALVNLARHPRLEDIRISFDPTIIVPTSGVSNSRIHTLSPEGRGPNREDTLALAAFFKKLLPTVYKRDIDDSLGWEDAWWDLNDYMAAHRSDAGGSDADAVGSIADGSVADDSVADSSVTDDSDADGSDADGSDAEASDADEADSGDGDVGSGADA